MTRHIGGDLVEVKSLATGVEDIHAVPMKPSFAVTLNRADVLVVLGLEAEHAFMPGLLEAARNPKIQRDAPGYIDCSMYIRPLEVPTPHRPLTGRPASDGQSALQPRPGAHEGRGAGDCRGLSRNYPDNASHLQAEPRRVPGDARR